MAIFPRTAGRLRWQAFEDVSDDDDQNMLDFDQPTTSGNVSAQVSPLFTYTTLLVNKNAVTFLDRSFLSFTLPDFDEVTNALHESKYRIVKREARGDVWIYTCRCNAGTRRMNYLAALSSSVNTESLVAADSMYMKCLHIQVIQELMEVFDFENGISPLLTGNSHLSLDHSYQVANRQIFPVSGCEFTVFVAGDKEDGVVGLQGSNIVCFTCEHQADNCEHVAKLTASEEELAFEMADFLVDFFAERSFRASSSSSTTDTTRKEWHVKCLSVKKISFNLTACQKQVFSTLEDILNSMISNNGLVKLIPDFSSTSSPTCPKCSFQCSETGSRQVPCFLKKKVFQCEVYYFKCGNQTCDGRLDFDGTELTLLNMGFYLLSYEVLRDFMFHFLKGRCTIFTYYSVWQEIMHDANTMDFERLLSYHHWRFGWYSFLELLDIDYKEGFCCPICGSGDLQTIICDATSLSFRQELCSALKNVQFPRANVFVRQSPAPRRSGR